MSTTVEKYNVVNTSRSVTFVYSEKLSACIWSISLQDSRVLLETEYNCMYYKNINLYEKFQSKWSA